MGTEIGFNLLHEGAGDSDTRLDSPDRVFDSLYPKWVRNLSAIHWTPVESAKVAAKWACRRPGARILDVGSGCGKFCIVGALTTSGNFVGVEQRKSLVNCARRAAGRLQTEQVEFLHQNAMSLDWSEFDSVYIFNPFSENLDRSIKISGEVKLSSILFVDYVQRTQIKFIMMPPGSRVVTLNGFGGEMPPGFNLIHQETLERIELKVWDKRW